jgi:hypothetical protein
MDGIERTALETAHILNLSAVRTKQLADQALKTVKAGALGERFCSAPGVVNLEKATEWNVRQGAVAISGRPRLPNRHRYRQGPTQSRSVRD